MKCSSCGWDDEENGTERVSCCEACGGAHCPTCRKSLDCKPANPLEIFVVCSLFWAGIILMVIEIWPF